MRIPVFALLVLGLFLPNAPAFAQAEGDVQVAQERKEHPDYGVLIFNIAVNKNGKRQCTVQTALLRSEQKEEKVAKVNTDPLLDLEQVFGRDRGAVLVLPPGTWTISFLRCDYDDFKGPIVQIKIAPGEIVNAGHVVIDRNTNAPKTETHIKIEELPADSVASLKKRAPQTFARSKRRSFAVNAALL